MNVLIIRSIVKFGIRFRTLKKVAGNDMTPFDPKALIINMDETWKPHMDFKSRTWRKRRTNTMATKILSDIVLTFTSILAQLLS